MSNSFRRTFEDKGKIEGDELMLRPVDLQVVIVKSVDSAQNVGYSQQLMSSVQQLTSLKEEREAVLSREKVLPHRQTENPNVGTSTDSQGGTKGFYTPNRKKKGSSDPYRGKIIDIRL